MLRWLLWEPTYFCNWTMRRNSVRERETVFLNCRCPLLSVDVFVYYKFSRTSKKRVKPFLRVLKGWVSGWFKLQACVWANKADPWRVFFQMYIWHLCFISAPFREWRPFKSNIICVEWGFTLKKPDINSQLYQWTIPLVTDFNYKMKK